MDNFAKNLVIVDENDNITGAGNVLKAHLSTKSKRHRAFSVFLFTEKDNEIKLLVQKRSDEKLVFPGLWSNTICSHPFINSLSFSDPVLDCKNHAIFRLEYELGITQNKINEKNLIFVEKLAYKAESATCYSGKLMGINDIPVTKPNYPMMKKENYNIELEYFSKYKSKYTFVENEIDYIFIALMNEDDIKLNLNSTEVSETKFVTKNELSQLLETDLVSPWFRIICKYVDIFSYLGSVKK